jgi:hypothetical protein
MIYRSELQMVGHQFEILVLMTDMISVALGCAMILGTMRLSGDLLLNTPATLHD